MSQEADITKKKKRRRHRTRVEFENLNKPSHPPTPLPDDWDEDAGDRVVTVTRGGRSAVKRDYSQAQRRAMAAEGRALPNGSYPIGDAEDLENAAVLARTGHGDAEAAKKLIRRRAEELGVSVPDLGDSAAKATGNPHQPGGRPVTDRLSPSRVTGGAARSTGDHNGDPMAPRGPRQAAYGHDDMRFGSTSVTPWATMRQRLGDNEFGDRTITRGPAGLVGLSILDAAGAAGMPGFRSGPHASPVSRPPDHSAQNSMTPPNGGHSLADPQSHAVALKASEAREILKDAFRRQQGR